METSDSKAMTLRVLINTKSEKVLFAEAGKEFVDFLFMLMSFPLGTVINLLIENEMVGALGKLYQSIENLGDSYMQPNVNKNILLKPKAPIGPSVTPLLLPYCSSSSNKRAYLCAHTKSYSHSQLYVAEESGSICPQCYNTMTNVVSYVTPKEGSSTSAERGGYVKGVVTYMVMDDLEVKPMSTISSITMLNTFNVKDIGSLEEKVVTIGMNEGLKLVKASLQSKTVLTDVFVGKKST